jgi:hypothetical protein
MIAVAMGVYSLRAWLPTAAHMGRRCPFGWANVAAPAEGRSNVKGWENGQTNTQKMEPAVAGSRQRFGWIDVYAAADFLAFFGCTLESGLGVDFSALLAFSFAVNSCFTCAVMVSMSTL